MARKNFILMLGVVSLSLVAFGLLVHSLNTRAIAEQRGDRQSFSVKGADESGNSPVVYSIRPQNQPPEERWIPLATDPADLGGGQSDLKAVYGQVYHGIMYFKVEHYGNWSITVFDYIYLDVDQNASTGYPIHGIGADYSIDIRAVSTGVSYYLGGDAWAGIPNPWAYLYVADDTNTWVAGVHLCHFCPEVDTSIDPAEHVGAFDAVVCNLWDHPNDDYMPDTGHFTLEECFCADPNADGVVDVVDVVYLVNYVFKSGPAPQCY